MDRDHILAEIRRTAIENGGKPLGMARFEAATGIRSADWLGRYWARWTDAQIEAGVTPNELQGRYDDEIVLGRLAAETRLQGHLPTVDEQRLIRRQDPTFPSTGVYKRFGLRRDLAAALSAYCADRAVWSDVRAIVEPLVAEAKSAELSRTAELGHVYLIRSGRHYKLGRSNAYGRRSRELAIQLPQRATTVHVIETDDPVGIEAYWHKRFAARRRNGEWFELTAEDVAAFKRRRRFM